MQWDDDDWYAPERISYQVVDIIAGDYDITGLRQGLIYDLPTGRFLRCRDDVTARMHPLSRRMHCGTLAFSRATWLRCGGYPDSSFGEDLMLYLKACEAGARSLPLENDGFFVYVRHSTNSWRFTPDDFAGAGSWQESTPPSAFTPGDTEFYRVLGSALAA